ncbi:cell surface protein [Lachnospiraceae bacterium KM106-2]|nr:cell surface protein [Lachnospiraceae bacterium KM106-2]
MKDNNKVRRVALMLTVCLFIGSLASSNYVIATTINSVTGTDTKDQQEENLLPLEEALYSIPTDWENDVWVNRDYKELTIGETDQIYPRRIPQIVGSSVANDIWRPTFHFTIVEGDSVTLNHKDSNQDATVTAVKPGISIIKVTYDRTTYKGTTYGASSNSNSAYIIYEVAEKGNRADIKIETSITETPYDTVYYQNGNYVPYTFTVSTDRAKSRVVSCNGSILKGEDGSYTARLENRSNIIGITATDQEGKTRSKYYVIDARKIAISVVNKTRGGTKIFAGDKIGISFKGITNPVPKLASIYNPTFYSPNYGNKGTCVTYTNELLGKVSGYCKQWDLATNNTIEVQFQKEGTYTFTNGQITSQWWGEKLGTDREVITLPQNTNAATNEGTFSSLPEFTIEVEKAGENTPAVTGIQLNKKRISLLEGGKYQLRAKVLPRTAGNQKIRYESSAPSYVKVNQEGKITAIKATGNKQVMVRAISDEGNYIASCKVQVNKKPVIDFDQAEESVSPKPTKAPQRTKEPDKDKDQKNQTATPVPSASTKPVQSTESLSKEAKEVKKVVTSLNKKFSDKDLLKTYRIYNALSKKEKKKVDPNGLLKQAVEKMIKTNHQDKKTDITIWNAENQTRLVVEEKEDLITKMQQKVRGYTLIKLWNISLFDIETDKEVEPEKTVKISVPLKESDDYDGYVIVHFTDDGKVHYIKAELKADQLIFETPSLSNFGIIGYQGASPLDLNAAVKKEDHIPWTVVGIGAGLILLLGVVMGYRMKNRTKSAE